MNWYRLIKRDSLEKGGDSMYLKRKIDEYLLEWKEKEERLADSNVGIEDGIYTFPYFCTVLLKRYLREKDEEKIVWLLD